MVYTEMTRKALKLCYEAHKGQFDKSGVPYVFHPYHLAEQMQDEMTTTVALLHDVLEDTNITRTDLEHIGFPDDVINAIELLTHSKPKMSDEEYDSYISNIKTNPIATAVKLADLEHNCDITRLETVTDKDTARTKRYERGIELLKTMPHKRYEIFTEEEQEKLEEMIDAAIDDECGYNKDYITNEAWDFFENQAPILVLEKMVEICQNDRFYSFDDIDDETIWDCLDDVIDDFECNHGRIRVYDDDYYGF